jgi:hypothetical protein
LALILQRYLSSCGADDEGFAGGVDDLGGDVADLVDVHDKSIRPTAVEVSMP